jgi:hypothetical protein
VIIWQKEGMSIEKKERGPFETVGFHGSGMFHDFGLTQSMRSRYNNKDLLRTQRKHLSCSSNHCGNAV